MRRRGRSRRSYSLLYLLEKQPKSLRRDPHYPQMIDRLRTSKRLQGLRFNRRCYSLLQQAKIAPENLKYFYRTYRLPKDPFFPLFFMIKRNYLEERKRKKEEKIRYIAARMRGLPAPVLSYIRFLAELEAGLNRSGRYPLWSNTLFPKTKKRVGEYETFRPVQWIAFFRDYLKQMEGRYRNFDELSAELLLACFIIEELPSAAPLRFPDEQRVKRSYRRLSKLHHPDGGGDSSYFVELGRAKELLLTRDAS
jgi:hypothetical protein